MNKMKEILKKSSRFILGLAIGLTLSIGVGYAVTVVGSSTTYSNGTSGLSSTNVQAAIDELYAKAEASKSNIVKAYTYDKTLVSSHTEGTGYSAVTINVYKCVTGEESTCVKTTCYQNKEANSCPPGTIIDYRVNNNQVVRFHVIKDDGTTMKLQSQKNTLQSAWYTSNDNRYGPTTALVALESATTGWTNVNDQTYSIGDSKTTLGFSGCGNTSSLGNGKYLTQCTVATYSLSRGPVKARMITLTEAFDVGCSMFNLNNCPIWMYNYLDGSTSHGGTANDTGYAYWTMSAATMNSSHAWYVISNGIVEYNNYPPVPFGVRAVVVISK